MMNLKSNILIQALNADSASIHPTRTPVRFEHTFTPPSPASLQPDELALHEILLEIANDLRTPHGIFYG
jgi:hypothetical protein